MKTDGRTGRRREANRRILSTFRLEAPKFIPCYNGRDEFIPVLLVRNISSYVRVLC
jgi:hypothetical protein